MTNEQWQESVARNRAIVLGIVLQEDIDPGMGKHILSQLDGLYGRIRIQYGKIMKQYKEIESWIYRIEHKGRLQGKNEADRKASGILAVENYRDASGATVNLYEVFEELTGKKEDLESLLDIIKSKNSLVITMSGLLKIESNLAGR